MSYPVYYVESGDTLPHLFDTFDGLPETGENDNGFFKKGMFKIVLNVLNQ